MSARDAREVTEEELTWLKLQLDWSDTNVRIQLAHNGVALNILVNDPRPIVRHSVAKQGYKLDILKNDLHTGVRDMAIAMEDEARFQKAKEITDDIFRQAGCL